MPTSERPIFREGAIERYQQKQEQEVLLRVSYPPALIFFWIFLLTLFAAAGFALSIQVPIVIQGQGVVIERKVAGQAGTEVVAELFFAPGQLAQLHNGQPVVVSIGATPTNVSGMVEHVDNNLISPDEARSRFKLQGGLAQVIIGPSNTVTITLSPTASTRVYAGSLCNAQIQTGSQSVLSLLPGFKQILGKAKV
ncbi:hypothetical protein [Dictyobacter kobayashii]|uniref:Uncharacterized protein n=1 Tax=Dictyobacter kobayashii TaxID=2014872 RepID=A0A402AM75_9CHLR|nr:hypothetical protein [Dictyobacter kobayashii]GCE20134.1 hypothetical protein KDK_39340 [Dictyobacter kobayashii]